MSDLQQEFEETIEFFDSGDPAKLLQKHAGKAVLLIVDPQRQYCDPKKGWGNEETDAIAGQIQTLASKFREANIPIYVSYYSPDPKNEEERKHDYSFHRFAPSTEDTLVAKTTNSAFGSGGLENILKKNKKELLLMCGFNQAACLAETAKGARRKGLEVFLLQDLAGNDDENAPFREITLLNMERLDVFMTTSDAVLKHLHTPKP